MQVQIIFWTNTYYIEEYLPWITIGIGIYPPIEKNWNCTGEKPNIGSQANQ